jgi:glycosyltransferase involved in cell wall biosynthesis
MAAAEAAAAGTASVVTDRCGIADLLGNEAGIVVPYEQRAVCAALARLLGDPELRRRLAAGARAVAAEWSWPRVVELQEDIYRQALERG